jgi:predicted TIM-barrel fold metal-dependent hydrolase
VRRIAALGLGAAMLPLVGTPEYNDPSWDPLWDAIEELGFPAVMHQGTGHSMLFYRGPGASVSNLLATQSMAPRSAALLATSGVLERHPGLHVVFVEVNASWIAWAMDTLDFYNDAFVNHQDDYGRNWVRPILAEKPSFYIRRQVHATFQDDPAAVANLGRTGVSPLLWGSDYPHEESTYPHSRATVERLFGGLDQHDAARIVGGTCAELFHFDDAVLTTPV